MFKIKYKLLITEKFRELISQKNGDIDYIYTDKADACLEIIGNTVKMIRKSDNVLIFYEIFKKIKQWLLKPVGENLFIPHYDESATFAITLLGGKLNFYYIYGVLEYPSKEYLDKSRNSASKDIFVIENLELEDFLNGLCEFLQNIENDIHRINPYCSFLKNESM